MIEKHKKKTFDCIEMKRKIQEKIANETEGMSTVEIMRYHRTRIENSRFAELFRLDKASPNKLPA